VLLELLNQMDGFEQDTSVKVGSAPPLPPSPSLSSSDWVLDSAPLVRGVA
jgi:hypothetical protein